MTKGFYFVAHNQEAKGISKHFECSLHHDKETLFDGVNIYYDEVASILPFRDRIEWDFVIFEDPFSSNFTGRCSISTKETTDLLKALAASNAYLETIMTEGLGMAKEIVRKENLDKLLAD